MLYYVLASLSARSLRSHCCYPRTKRQQLELEAMQLIHEAYERGRMVQQSDDSEFGGLLNNAASIATIISLLGRELPKARPNSVWSQPASAG